MKSDETKFNDTPPGLSGLRDKLQAPRPPAGYWNELEASVWQQVQTGAHRPKRIWLRSGLRIAASVALLLVAGWWWLHTSEATGPPVWEDVPEEELREYVLANLDEFDWEWLLSTEGSVPLYELDNADIHDYLENELDEDWLDNELF